MSNVIPLSKDDRKFLEIMKKAKGEAVHGILCWCDAENEVYFYSWTESLTFILEGLMTHCIAALVSPEYEEKEEA